jgi:hypothetical protein
MCAPGLDVTDIVPLLAQPESIPAPHVVVRRADKVHRHVAAGFSAFNRASESLQGTDPGSAFARQHHRFVADYKAALRQRAGDDRAGSPDGKGSVNP